MTKLRADFTHEPEAGGDPQQLVIFLHGVGSNGQDLIQIAPLWAKQLPNAVFVSPNAPFSFDLANFGYQWFSLQSPDPILLEQGADKARPFLDDFIDEMLRTYNLKDKDLALVGFSQGTMMALHTSTKRKKPCGAVLGYSGTVVFDNPEYVEQKPPVMLVHGENDNVVPFAAMNASARILEEAGVDVKTEGRPGLMHGIDDEGLELGLAFIKEKLGA